MPTKGRPEIPILPARLDWDCPNCSETSVTNEARPHTRFHVCAGLGGLTTPLVQKSANRGSVRVRKVVREDYVGKEHGLTYDNEGQPIMAVVTDYDDGTNDAAVFAPAVRVEMRS